MPVVSAYTASRYLNRSQKPCKKMSCACSPHISERVDDNHLLNQHLTQQRLAQKIRAWQSAVATPLRCDRNASGQQFEEGPAMLGQPQSHRRRAVVIPTHATIGKR